MRITMADVCWIQISDLHFGFDTYTTKTAYDAFIAYLDNVIRTRAVRPTLLFLTGDFVFAPASSYANRNQAVTAIKEIQRITGISNDNLFMVPGNHDVNINAATRTLYLEDIYKNYRPTDGSISSNHIGKILEGFKGFNDFRKQVYGRTLPLCKEIHEIVETQNLNLILMNTAFAYGKNHTEKLIFGVKYFQNILQKIKNNKPIILLAHHPLKDAVEEDLFINEITGNRKIKLYLCGHEHRFSIKRFLQDGQMWFNTPTFMNEDSRTKEPCQIGFTIGEMDTDTGSGLIEAHIYDAAFRFWDLYRQYGGAGNPDERDRINGIYRY